MSKDQKEKKHKISTKKLGYKLAVWLMLIIMLLGTIASFLAIFIR